jgi:hypothetical protein
VDIFCLLLAIEKVKKVVCTTYTIYIFLKGIFKQTGTSREAKEKNGKTTVFIFLQVDNFINISENAPLKYFF